jgi:hypothetical protein
LTSQSGAQPSAIKEQTKKVHTLSNNTILSLCVTNPTEFCMTNRVSLRQRQLGGNDMTANAWAAGDNSSVSGEGSDNIYQDFHGVMTLHCSMVGLTKDRQRGGHHTWNRMHGLKRKKRRK